jgi:uncharacterized membrane protein
VFLWPGKAHTAAQPAAAGSQRAYGQVLQVSEQACQQGAVTYGNQPCGTAIVHVTSGPGANSNVQVSLPQGPGAPTLAVGDQLVLSARADPQNPSNMIFDVADKQRGQQMLIMIGLAAVVIVAFGRLRGVAAIIGLGVSFAVLLLFVIPAILNGESPLPVAIAGSAAVMFAVLYLAHGVRVSTSVAVLGTLASLVLTGLLGWMFTLTMSLTGFGSEGSLDLSILNGNVDMRGLLLAGIIIGALGVLDDVTITQSLTVAELAEGARSRRHLYRAAIRVGRAHVASAVNTIIMAYAGASLPVLLILTVSGTKLSDLLTGQNLAEEIVRAVVGTIGLVAAVPITTGLAVLVADIRRRPVSDVDDDGEEDDEDYE